MSFFRRESPENSTGPISLSKDELRILQENVKPNDPKWKEGASLVSANGVKPDSGIIEVLVDGKPVRIDTASGNFAQIVE
jgi:hypothetical protein